MLNITSKPTNDRLDPLSIRPKPNTRYESVTQAMLVENGAKIMLARSEIRRIESDFIQREMWQANLTEWRRTLRMLLDERKKLKRAAQMRLF
jgi:hypothetical protein